jgi:hypothetical protein
MRIILIDNYSGYIWGDSADYKGRTFTLDDALSFKADVSATSEDDFALAYAAAMDADIGGEPRSYGMHRASCARNGGSGYMAYRADVDGSEAVPVVHDGQDSDTIEAVEADCRCLGFISYHSAEQE